jgi:hypothetical protein
MSQAVDDMLASYDSQRRSFERRWYDNNFFDDGFHFRYLSRSTGKIIDDSSRATQSSPRRAIPKASRQIRGVANLLMALDPFPAIYPESVSRSMYQTDQEYAQALQEAKQIAQRTGHWITEEWKNQDIKKKTAQMLILAAKHGISYMQVWADPVQERIRTSVWDAFDIYLMGNLTEIYDSPSIIKAVPTLISEIKANELFDPVQRMMINPDNKYASSEVKEAYMQSRFGALSRPDSQATLILKEAFIKEVLDDEVIARIKQQKDPNGALEGKNKNDIVIRHTFTTSNGTLFDEYTALPEYPFVDYRYEPGLIYQVPLIERFIPANKSMDVAVSRIEGYANTMVSGIWQKRKGENYQVSNMPGGQMIEYEQTPLSQMNMATVPQFMFQYINLLDSIIAEQGATTAALGQLPDGVRSGTAIESIKATEFANLKTQTEQLKDTIKRVTERMIDIAHDHFISPQTVMRLEEGEPDYFQIVGQRGAAVRREANIPLPKSAVVIKKDYHVDIEIESGLGYTMQGKKDSMLQIVEYMGSLAQRGLLTQDAVTVMTRKFLETFQFGSTQEFMDAMESGLQSSQLTQDQTAQIKISLLEVLKDAGLVGQQREADDIEKTKVAVAEVAKDLAGREGGVIANNQPPI